MMSELGKMRVWQLKDALKGRGLPASGNKILLVSRLEDAMGKDEALEMCLREEQEEEQEAFEWLNNQELNRRRAERQSRDLEEMEGEVGNGTVEYVKQFAKKRIDQEKAVLKKLKDEDEKDRSELIKLTAIIKARNKAMLCKEEQLKRKQTAVDLFIFFFS